MCMFNKPEIAAPIIPHSSNKSAQRQGDYEASLRRSRAGAAANILTSPVGIPSGASTTTLGGI